MDVGLERLGIGILEVLERSGPSKRANDIDVDAVLAPLVGSDAGQTADALLGSGVAALPAPEAKLTTEPLVSFRCG